ncbi:hypothetical protein GCM10028807_62750 [Spirosoma daeguense]
MTHQVPENILWTEFKNGKGDERKGFVVIARKDDAGTLKTFTKGFFGQLVFKEPGDMDYSDDRVVAELFNGNGKHVACLMWRSWQEVLDTWEFRPRKNN